MPPWKHFSFEDLRMWLGNCPQQSILTELAKRLYIVVITKQN